MRDVLKKKLVAAAFASYFDTLLARARRLTYSRPDVCPEPEEAALDLVAQTFLELERTVNTLVDAASPQAVTIATASLPNADAAAQAVGIRNLGGWLWTCLYHRFLDMVGGHPPVRGEEAAKAIEGREDPAPKADDLLRDLQQWNAVVDAIAHAGLTETEREVVELDLEGNSTSTIAARLGTTDGNVRQARFRAHKKIRTYLAQEYGGKL